MYVMTQCLIMDERALRTIEVLPAEPPELKFRTEAERRELFPPRPRADRPWLWILDREYLELREAGEWLGGGWIESEPGKRPYPPWARINVGDLFDLWFMRCSGGVPGYWGMTIEEDRVKWDTVLWWCAFPRASNDIYRDARKRKREEDAQEAEKRPKEEEKARTQKPPKPPTITS